MRAGARGAEWEAREQGEEAHRGTECSLTASQRPPMPILPRSPQPFHTGLSSNPSRAQGYLVGNGVTDVQVDGDALPLFAAGKSLISQVRPEPLRWLYVTGSRLPS